MKVGYVYILSNWNNKVLYAGSTTTLKIRVGQHKAKLVEGFTKKYNVTKLVFFEEFKYITDAIAAERRIKGWKREKKVKLIESINPSWRDLYDDL